MDRALWLLMALQLGGWLRFLGRNLRTVKGVVLALVGGTVFAPWLITAMLVPAESAPDREMVLRYGPLILLALTLVNVLFTFTSQRAISFSPAEVNFLFPGPFSRRQLLAYKIGVSLGASLLATPFVALALQHHAACFVSAWVGLVLALTFLQLSATALALLASSAGAHAYNRSRKVLLAGLVAALAAAAFWVGKEALSLGPNRVLEVLEPLPLWQALRAPFRWFVLAFLAEQLWPDLVLRALPPLGVNAALLLVIFALDAHYLEAAASSSERVYAQLERLRSGGMLSLRLPGSGKARFSLPSLPWWGGIGPTLWRQLLGALRGFVPLLMLAGFYGLTLVPIVLSIDRPRRDHDGILILASTLAGTTLFLTTMIAYDFRADLDRIELLKTLPVAPHRLVMGQLAAPVLLVGTLQLAVLVVAQVLLGRVDTGLLLTLAVFVYPFNFLVFGIENLLFLWFPTRLVPTTPGDFQIMGRHMLLMLAKVLGMLAALAGAGAFALAALLLALLLKLGPLPTRLAVLSAGWLGLTGVALALVPLIALAFRRFDVSRDTPP